MGRKVYAHGPAVGFISRGAELTTRVKLKQVRGFYKYERGVGRHCDVPNQPLSPMWWNNKKAPAWTEIECPVCKVHFMGKKGRRVCSQLCATKLLIQRAKNESASSSVIKKVCMLPSLVSDREIPGTFKVRPMR